MNGTTATKRVNIVCKIWTHSSATYGVGRELSLHNTPDDGKFFSVDGMCVCEYELYFTWSKHMFARPFVFFSLAVRSFTLCPPLCKYICCVPSVWLWMIIHLAEIYEICENESPTHHTAYFIPFPHLTYVKSLGEYFINDLYLVMMV